MGDNSTNTITAKSCVLCRVTKDLDEFHKVKTEYRDECKSCIIKIYEDPSKEQYKVCKKCGISKLYADFQLRTDNNSIEYRSNCRACQQEYINTYRRNSKKTKEKQNQRARERRKTDPWFLTMQRIRARMTKAMMSQSVTKNHPMEELLGCTVKEFKEHLERQFKPGMSWEEKNFVIDHIIPCSHFDLTDIEEQKKCFNYKNMQPLTFKENAKKGDKILPEHEDLLKSMNLLRINDRKIENPQHDNPQPSS